MDIVDWTDANRSNWDDRTVAHLAADGRYYDVKGVKAGRSSLLPIELQLAGEVKGCRLLHLMCHFGLDSICWAHGGAKVTAVDFSSASITAARALATDAGVDVAFHLADVLALPTECDGPFDLVVMTYGVLCWLPDLGSVVRAVEERLAPGGRFILVDAHPIVNLWPDTAAKDGYRPSDDSYFAMPEPRRCERPRSYGGGGNLPNPVSYQWRHSVADVVQSVLDAGLILRTLREEPYGFYRRYPGMERRSDGYFDPPPGMPSVPLLLALEAQRPLVCGAQRR